MGESNFVTAVETERKFIIEMPDFSVLRGAMGYTLDLIRQDYLSSPAGITHRVRRRERAGEVRYFETLKCRIGHGSSEESEREIDRGRYDELLNLRDPSGVGIEKARHSFSFDGLTFEVDVYPTWQHSCIMEVELPDIDFPVSIPPFISIIRDVTGDFRYSNAAMARAFPPELI